MNDDERKHLERLKNIHRRNLEIYENQAATFGLSAPPHILLQIEDLKTKIAEIDRQLNGESEPNTIPSTSKNKHTTILFLAADPTDKARLRLGEEMRAIQERLQMAQLRDTFTFDQRMSVRPADISQAMLDVAPQIVHFSGHGGESGALFFETLAGRTQPVEPAALAALFSQFSDIECPLKI